MGKIALHSSGSFVLFNEEVTGISSSSDSGHKVTTKSGKVFECINAVIATGLGIPKLPCRKDEKSLNLIQGNKREMGGRTGGDWEYFNIAHHSHSSTPSTIHTIHTEELRITASSPLLSNKNRIMTVDQALRRVDSLDPLGIIIYLIIIFIIIRNILNYSPLPLSHPFSSLFTKANGDNSQKTNSNILLLSSGQAIQH